MPAALPLDLTTIRARREALGLTQTQLAERVGVSQGDISGYETGAIRPSDGVEAALCAALGRTRGQWSDAADALAMAAPKR